jgi:F0F1-type ATP synthase assembly protein I
MLAIIALVCFLCAIVLAIILEPRAWGVALLAAGLAAWLAETGAGFIP